MGAAPNDHRLFEGNDMNIQVLTDEEIDAIRDYIGYVEPRAIESAILAKLKGWDVQGAVTTQGDKAYKRGFSDGMKEAPTGESWIRAIDEAMVGAHIGVAEMADDYGTAKKKLNALICWSVQVDRDLSRAQAAPAVGAPDGYVLVPVEPTPEMIRQGRITPCTADEMDADDDYRAVYKAMIASAQPQQKEG